MKQYYIFIENEQLGPFMFEELSSKKISRETKVWFEGLENWKNASEIEELESILMSIPPPINSFTSPPPLPQFVNKQNIEIQTEGKEEEESVKIFGLRKNVFYVILGVLVIVGFIYFKNVQEANRVELLQQNQQTESYNQQIQEQNKRLEEQEKIETERKALEKEKGRIEYIGELEKVLTVRRSELENAEKKLIEVTGFKLLRSSGERAQQVKHAQSQVEWLKHKVDTIEIEMKRINPDWEN